MLEPNNRRGFFAKSAMVLGAVGLGESASRADKPQSEKRGDQRLSLEQLKRWEGLGYGMFIHFGISTFDGRELSDGRQPATLYAPDKLDVDQWVSVARDSGMKYAVLCAKHVAGFCLWPSKWTDYTVANSGNKTNVLEKFVDSCRRRGVLPGFYYCSWDNHNRFGSKTPSDGGRPGASLWFPEKQLPRDELPAFTTSLYQNFQTAQVTELLTQYGPVVETWIDIPVVLGRGYRESLYAHIARLQPETIILMNNGIGTGENFKVPKAWPSDAITIERRVPPPAGHRKWRTIEGREFYMPGEVCETIGKEWFFVPGDKPRPDEELLKLYRTCRERNVNLLLDVPPDKHGVIPQEYVAALTRLAKNAKI
ncbi:MAG: alpha-L-fucosidase [Pirellulales bacterium]|nr:alpha-L-fucosidase [Pirellulales bacterium]